MKKLPLVLCLAATFAAGQPARNSASAAAARKPKLVLAIVVDQFRLDYFYRFAPQYKGGLARLATQGAFFTNAHYEHSPTVTAIGHSTLLTGAFPAVSGIIANDWYDRASGKHVTSVEDAATKKLGGSEGIGSSPRRLLVSTLGDELKSANAAAKVIGISLKDRSAILPAGHAADGAFWFDDKSSNFVSSTYYFPALPAWVKEFNDSQLVERYFGSPWISAEDPKAAPFFTMPTVRDQKFGDAMEATPYGNEIVEELAERAIDHEKLGADAVTDVLAVSFSSNDYVGHAFGPDDARVRDISIRTDRAIGRLFDYLDKKVGMANVLVVLTADHGVAPTPEAQQSRKMPGGRIAEADVKEAVRAYLNTTYGVGAEWIPGKNAYSIFLDRNLIAAKGLDARKVRAEVAKVVRALPHIARVFTYDDLAAAQIGDTIDRRVRNGFYAPRAADLELILEPYFIFSTSGTTHGSPYNYDSHVPLVLMGPGIKPGRYHHRAAPNDIAPTIATMLEVEVPSGAMGRVLDEALR